MIVCLCKAVSDREVNLAIGRGATTLAQLGRACGAGTGARCGGCHGALRDLLQARLARSPRGLLPATRGPLFALASPAGTGYLTGDDKKTER
ncbi:MAG: hypothetical protein EON47_24645 [Acetobacteraceae bacterium]|nr:MAG: hypothetical protein EON47_24645 [Acetobacteraceae bacterium]